MQIAKQQVHVAIIGAGTVGSGTATILAEHAQEIACLLYTSDAADD